MIEYIIYTTIFIGLVFAFIKWRASKRKTYGPGGGGGGPENPNDPNPRIGL